MTLIDQAESLLKIRDVETGQLVPYQAWPVILRYEIHASKRNIVLKGRQMGMTTWALASNFLTAFNQPGSIVFSGFTNQEHALYAAEVVRIFAESAGMPLHSAHRGMLKLANGSRYYFGNAAGCRGVQLDALHLSELAWSDSNLFYSTMPCLREDGRLLIESSGNGSKGDFYQCWAEAEKFRLTRHFFPWWIINPAAGETCEPVDPSTLTEKEQSLVDIQGLSLKQIAYRRLNFDDHRALCGSAEWARKDFPEEPEDCWMAHELEAA